MSITMIKRCALLVGVANLLGCSHRLTPFQPTASERVATRLKDIERVEIFAIDPFSRQLATQPTTRLEEPDRFFGYRVVGRATVDDSAATRGLATSIAAAASDPPEGVAKGCIFVPHHAVRFTLASGKTVDFVICFTCGDAVMSGDGSSDQFWIAGSEVADFSTLFQRYGVPVPVID